jgi:opacity protein-like surface antigen
MAVLGLLALVSWSAQAEQGDSRWRAGVQATFGTFEGDDVPAAELGDKFINDNAVGYKIYSQYQVNNWLALEGAYHHSGSYEDRSTSEALPGKLELSFSGFSAQALLFAPTSFDDFKFYVKGGIYDLDDDLVVNGSTNSTSSESGLVLGAGVVFELSDSIGFRAEYERMDPDVGTLSSINLGIEYSFGSPSAK